MGEEELLLTQKFDPDELCETEVSKTHTSLKRRLVTWESKLFQAVLASLSELVLRFCDNQTPVRDTPACGIRT